MAAMHEYLYERKNGNETAAASEAYQRALSQISPSKVLARCSRGAVGSSDARGVGGGVCVGLVSASVSRLSPLVPATASHSQSLRQRQRQRQRHQRRERQRPKQRERARGKREGDGEGGGQAARRAREEELQAQLHTAQRTIAVLVSSAPDLPPRLCGDADADDDGGGGGGGGGGGARCRQ
eukprot:422289-Rhodomonas_salina.1